MEIRQKDSHIKPEANQNNNIQEDAVMEDDEKPKVWTSDSTNWLEAFEFKIENSKDLSPIHSSLKKDAFCECCCQSAKIPNKADLLYSYMYWKYCFAWAHVKWYGEGNQLYRCKAQDGAEDDLLFVCDKCAYCQNHKLKSTSVKWILCLKPNGIMKRVHIENSQSENKEFCHVVWGFYCDEIETRDHSLMKFYRKQHGTKVYENENKCQFCETADGFMLAWDKQSCKHTWHPFWMAEDLKEVSARDEDSTAAWEIYHTEYVSYKSKAIPDRQGIGIVGYEDCEVTDSKRKNKWKRGGFIVVYWEIHKAVKEYCTWRIEEGKEEDEFMIWCDFWGKLGVVTV